MKGVVLRQLGLKTQTLFTDGGARGMATGADIMCGRIDTGTPTKDEKIQIQGAEFSSTLSIPSTIGAPVVEVEGELLKVPVTLQESSSWTSKWWRPDPATGTWVPEGHEGQVTTSTDATKPSASPRLRVRSETTTAASMEDKPWWTSMEELPDMDRAK